MQFTQVYVQKSISTTCPRSSSITSGALFSQCEMPANSGAVSPTAPPTAPVGACVGACPMSSPVVRSFTPDATTAGSRSAHEEDESQRQPRALREGSLPARPGGRGG